MRLRQRRRRRRSRRGLARRRAGARPPPQGLTLLALLAASTPAFGWASNGYVWRPEDLPLAWSADVSPTFPLEPGEARAAIRDAFDRWRVASGCSGLAGDEADACPDRGVCMDVGDAAGRTAAGVLAAMRCTPYQQPEDGELLSFHHCDVWINDDVAWTTDAAIAAGGCDGELSFDAMMTYELSTIWGLASSCRDGLPCSGPPDLPGIRECAPAEPIPDDAIAGIGFLYGTGLDARCDRQTSEGAVGNVPFALRCVAAPTSAGSLAVVTWDWGDGTTSTGERAEHVYEDQGEYAVRVTGSGTSDACPTWATGPLPVTSVVACDVAEPSFTYERVGRDTIQLRNDTPLDTYGCVTAVEWDVFDEDGRLVDTLDDWEPAWTAPSRGDWRIVLNVGGPAGTAAAELTVRAGRGCDTTGSPPLPPLILAGAALAATRSLRRHGGRRTADGGRR